MKLSDVRKDFPVLERKIGGKKVVYLDNAATSLKPQSVIDAEKYYYENVSANVHRGLHLLSEEASIAYENAHDVVAKFVGSKREEVVFTRNTTEGLNLVMYSLMNSDYFKKGDKIVVSKMEHHSNIVPWQFLEKKLGVKLEFVGLTSDYQVDMADFERKVQGAKLVSFSGASNTVATVPDVRAIEKMTHKQGALLCVDGAQLVPHKEVDFKAMNADFLSFSAHKMCGPTGMGGLIGKKQLLGEFEPFMFGGDMIHSVDWHSSTWNTLPYKFEAGTPNIAGAYGIRAACEYLQKVGFRSIEEQERILTKVCIEELGKIDSIKMYCPQNEKKQGGIVLFNSSKLSPHDLAMALSETDSICIRSGMHCAEPLVSSLNKDGLARASFYFYNTEEEIRFFAKSLKNILDTFA